MAQNQIGTLNEKALHSSLKEWYAQQGDRLEQSVDGYVIDIVRGDLLVVDSVEYPIQYVEPWPMLNSGTASFISMATKNCSTKRSSIADDAGAGIKKGSAAAEHLTGLSCLPLMPLDARTAEGMGLKDPHTLLETFLSDDDEFYRVVVEKQNPHQKVNP